MNILLLGPQGSGKGTQAKRIASEYGLAHISTGDIIREAIKAGTPLGRQVQDVVESGQLVSDELVIDLIRDRLAQPDTEEGFILDGFPRTMAQAEALDAMLEDLGRPLSIVFELQVPDDVGFERMLKRAEEEGRADDTPEVIRKRLELYHAETEPLVEHYRTRGSLLGIHGDRSVPEVFREIQETLEVVSAR